MKNWKQVKVPPLMEDLEKDRRGYPVPFIILRDKSGHPNFIVNDDRLVWKCLEEKLCHVCGKHMPVDDMWMLGGPLSAYHPQGAFNDGPVHKQCGEYALQVCPYLAVSNYNGKQTMADIDAGKFEFPDGAKVQLVNPTQDSARVPFFAFCRVSGYNVNVRGLNRYVMPIKPYLEEEFWNDGVRIEAAEVAEYIDKIKPKTSLNVYCLYNNPSDFPGEFVVRIFRVYDDGRIVPDQDAYMKDANESVIREHMNAKGLSFMNRNEGDDPTIVGTWI